MKTPYYKKYDKPLGLLPRRTPSEIREDSALNRRISDTMLKEFGSVYSLHGEGRRGQVETLSKLGEYCMWTRALNEERERIGCIR